uniref:Uncharacterized protein n=1 Tax=Ciona intestinalis TaxID=7719 RepID=H2Y1Z8_CIOIN
MQRDYGGIEHRLLFIEGNPSQTGGQRGCRVQGPPRVQSCRNAHETNPPTS